MKPNYGGNRKRKEEARRKKQEEKRNKRLNKSKHISTPETGAEMQSPGSESGAFGVNPPL